MHIIIKYYIIVYYNNLTYLLNINKIYNLRQNDIIIFQKQCLHKVTMTFM